MMQINGKKINLKLVRLNDANFILKLRQDKNLNKYISHTPVDLDAQKEWIKNYLKREEDKKEFYFIVVQGKKKYGTVRIYDIDNKKKKCTWGSFILNENRPNKSSYEVIELSLNYAFEILKMEKIFLNVYKKNEKAIYIYEKSGFKRYKEDSENYYYYKIREENK